MQEVRKIVHDTPPGQYTGFQVAVKNNSVFKVKYLESAACHKNCEQQLKRNCLRKRLSDLGIHTSVYICHLQMRSVCIEIGK